MKYFILLISCIISFLLFEYCGGLVLKAKIGERFNTDIDHRLKPNPREGINQDGIRCGYPASYFTSDSFNIIFLGDSFTYGLLVPNAAAFPSQVNELLSQMHPSREIKVANFGWDSSSPVLSYRLLKEIGARYHPKLVILCLDMTDFHDDLKYRRLLSDQGYTAFSPTIFLLRRFDVLKYWLALKRRIPWLRSDQDIPADRFFIVNQPLASSRKYLREIENNIVTINQYCKEQLGAPFILLCLPRSFQYSVKECLESWEKNDYTILGPYVEEPFVWLAEFKKRVDFPVFSLLEDFKHSGVFPTCYPFDPHWNKKGHQVAARAIVRILKQLAEEKFIPITFAKP